MADWCDLNPESCPSSYAALRPSGQLNGWQYAIVLDEADSPGPVNETGGPGFQLEAEPIFPGVTRSESLVMDGDGNVTGFPTPGADEGRRQMFARIHDRETEAVSDLLNMDGAPALARGYVASPDTPAAVFRMFDRDADGPWALRYFKVSEIPMAEAKWVRSARCSPSSATR